MKSRYVSDVSEGSLVCISLINATPLRYRSPVLKGHERSSLANASERYDEIAQSSAVSNETALARATSVCVSALAIYDLRIDPGHEIEDINQRSAAFCARGWPLLTQIGSFSRVAFTRVARGKSSEVEAPRSEARQGRAGQGESAGFSKGGFRERSIVPFDISSRSFHRGKRTHAARVVAQNKKKEKKRKCSWKMRVPTIYRTQIHTSCK